MKSKAEQVDFDSAIPRFESWRPRHPVRVPLPALLRPGRFDRQVLVDRPDRSGRLEILKVHVAKIRLVSGVHFNAAYPPIAGVPRKGTDNQWRKNPPR